METVDRQNRDDRERDSASTASGVSEIAASVASKLARNQGGGTAPFIDDRQVEASAPTEANPTCAIGRLDDGPATTQAVTGVPDHQVHRKKVTSDEYRKRFHACLFWAQEADSDDVRLACLTLAQVWLKAASAPPPDVPNNGNASS
jgi:hypothetical protein